MIRTINPISVSPMNSKTYSRIRIRNFVTTFALRICDDTFIPRFDLPPHVHSLRYSNLNERLSRPRLLGILLTWLHVCLTKDGPTSLAPISRLSSRNQNLYYLNRMQFLVKGKKRIRKNLAINFEKSTVLLNTNNWIIIV